MPATIHTLVVPKIDWNGRAADMRSRLVTWEWFWKLPKGRTELLLDFSAVSFMEPWALAMFAAYGSALRDRGIPVRARLDSSNPSNVYFEQMGLTELLEQGKSSAASQQWADSFQNTGLHVIRNEADIATFRQSASRLTLTHCQDAADALKWAMTELSRNVIQHSGSGIGGVAIAQHFPDRKAIQVAIVDLGQGVRKSLETRYPELRTDLESLRLAVLPHSSGAIATGPYGDSTRNAGLGLFTCREIAWRAGGSFWCASGRALLGIRGDMDAVWDVDPATPVRVYRTIENWPGTIVVLDFPVDGIPDFAGITSVWLALADEARRVSGPAGVDFLNSVAEINDDSLVVHVAQFDENVTEAERVRTEEIRPRIEKGQTVVLDFAGVRAPTQSFLHALLYDVFRVPGSLLRLSFLNCTGTAREVVKAVAAYASYKQIV